MHILLRLGGNRLKPCTFLLYQTEIEGSSKNPKNPKEGKTMGVLRGNPKKGRPSKIDHLDQESIPCQVGLESAVRSIRRFLTLLETWLMLEKPELIIFILDHI